MILGLPQGFKSTGREAHEYDISIPPPPRLLEVLGVREVLEEPGEGAKMVFMDPELVRGLLTFAGGGM